MTDAERDEVTRPRLIELERSDAARAALEEAAKKLENYSTNTLYQKALTLGARLIREMKAGM